MARALGVLLFACTAGVALGFAQDASQGIPAEVLSMLGPTTAGGGGELRPGGPPADFPAGIFPAGTTPVATMIAAARSTVVVVAAAPKTSLDDIDKHEAVLLAGGWVSNSPRSRGFSPSPVTGAQFAVCRGADFVSLTSQPRPAGGLYLRATLMRDPRRTCVPSPAMTMMADVDFPRLPPPAGARQVGGGGGGGGLDDLSSRGRIETSLAPRAVVEHYEKLLVGAGWKVVGRVRDGDEMALTRFEVPSRIGPPLSAWLAATKLADTGDQDIFMRVVRTTRDPRAFAMPPVNTTLTPTR